ncbi:hypothetical protein [Thermoleptolyngbya sp. M55_K2018_002]|uniref:hypothetical protein n=1 Tax=Thermoleptolyngbya sp. M55_K2018_002 TaxID=2747808 RepID=UPI001A0D0284|nr:hypothetical protein [Thermoleptolyngbya sp. M55_K2018_002]HIK40912.1 hypothetical protein [Thermoleptolyngbya sp. M55_K2018_002]
MADALRDTDGWLNRDVGSLGSLESSPMPQTEALLGCHAAYREGRESVSHGTGRQGDRAQERVQDRVQDSLARNNAPEIEPRIEPRNETKETKPIEPEIRVGSPKHLSKISPEFGARLEHLKPQQKIRAVVMLETDRSEVGRGPGSPMPPAPARRQTPEERQAAIARIRAAAQRSLEEIRPILEAFHANLLAPSPDAVGAVPVEIDAAGIPVLAQSNRVRTILEDQEIHTIDGSRVRRSRPLPFSR